MTRTKKWLIAAAILITTGILLWGGALTMLNWDFSKLSTTKYELNNYEIQDNYKHITVETVTADIQIVPSQDGNTTIVCYENPKVKHRVSAENDKLSISVHDSRKWYDYIGINFDTPKITLYIPQGAYGNIAIRSNTGKVEIPKEFQFENIQITSNTGNIINHASAAGDIHIQTSTGNILTENLTAGNLQLSVTTGSITVSNITCSADAAIHVSTGKTNLSGLTCKNLKSNGNTGDITLNNVIASQNLSIERSTGDVKFDRCDAGEITVKTDTGNVTGTLLTDKVFITETDTGAIRVPETTTGGKCKISTDTGDIRITIPQ